MGWREFYIQNFLICVFNQILFQSRNLDWLFGGFSLFGAPSSELAENTETNDQRIKLQNKSFQRRTSKIEPDEVTFKYE